MVLLKVLSWMILGYFLLMMFDVLLCVCMVFLNIVCVFV